MRIFLVAFIGVLLGTTQVMAADLDPLYTKTFGANGALAVSSKGFPAKDKCDPSQFDFKGTTFFLKPGAASTLDVRTVLPAGKKLGDIFAQLLKDKPQNLKNKTGEYFVWRYYYDHDESGKLLVDAKRPWPAKLTDEPIWCEPKNNWMEYGPDSADWVGAAQKWEDVKPDMDSVIERAKAGDKVYVTFCAAYEYKTPGGEIENKWDSDLKKWVPVKSNGLIGYVYSDPIAACTIEFK